MILFLALLLDWFVGDPDALWKKIPHPVVVIGNVVDALDKYLNSAQDRPAIRRRWGQVCLLVLLSGAGLAGLMLTWVLSKFGPAGLLLEIVGVSIFLAQKSLVDHVQDVVSAIKLRGVEGGRAAVSKIVGRDCQNLDESGICRAAIESLAENFSDAVVAPVFWYAVGGLPGLFIYKAINTADSMIGHKNDQYLHFGRAVALFDDLINWPAARTSAMLIALAGMLSGGLSKGVQILERALRDGGLHRSVNAGWPETAMAAALGITLGGARTYGDVEIIEARLNADGKSDIAVKDVVAALILFKYACYIMWFFVLAWYLMFR